MIGSRPVVGSSKNRISGSVAIARASPTRFCMPPESSAGDRSATSAGRPTRPKHLDRALLAPRAAATFLTWSRPKATFSQTGRLSNSADALEQHAELLHHLLARAGATGG